MFASAIETDIAPSWTLLGLLQRGRGDGWLHALAADRAEAVAALERCVLHDPRPDWRLEHRSLYYARLYAELGVPLDGIAAHLAHPEDARRTDEERTGLALSVLGHLTSYGNREALALLRAYAVRGSNWRWALDELAVRDDDVGLRALGPEILARFPQTEEGEAALTAAVRDSFERRPWQLWADDPQRPRQRARLARALEAGAFDRWRRQLRPSGPQPAWSVRAVLDWAQEGWERTPRQWRVSAAARCLGAVAGLEDRPELRATAAQGPPAARATALRHLAERGDPEAFALIAAAATDADRDVARAAVTAFSRMSGPAALAQARHWARRPDDLGVCAAALLASRGEPKDAPTVLAALRSTVHSRGPNARELRPLVDGAGRFALSGAVPVLRRVYRETASSELRGHAAAALARTDPGFSHGLAVECLWDCEEDTRELAARHAATGDHRVVERLRRLASDPAEQAGVQTVVRGRLAGHAGS